MATDEEIKIQAQYYIDNNVTMKEAGLHFGICKKTFQVRMKKLESIAPDMYKLVQEKKTGNLTLGMVKGGQNGKPSPGASRSHIMTSEEVVTLAQYALQNDLSLRELETVIGISKSTIFDNFTEEILGIDLYSKINKMFESHRPQNKAK